MTVDDQESLMFGDLKSEDEKLQHALELAFDEISKDNKSN